MSDSGFINDRSINLKKYILIYAYTFFSEDEIAFWESVNEVFNESGYHLFLMAPVKSKVPLSFEYALFTEKLSEVSPFKRNYFFKPNKFILNREYTWYGKPTMNLKHAYFTQVYKYKKLLSQLKPSYALIANGHHAGELILLTELKKANVDYSFFERGCITNTWHIDKQGITAGSSIAKMSFTDLNYSNQDIFKNYEEYYFKSSETWWEQPKIKWTHESLRKRFQIIEGTPVILFANQLDNDTSNFLYSPLFNDNLDAFDWLVNQIKSLNLNCYVIIKKHPHFRGSIKDFEDVLLKHGVNGAWVDDVPLENCISFSSHIAAVNSTMVLDGFMNRKPTITLGKSIYSNKDIFWEITSRKDSQTIRSWIKSENIDQRLNRFRIFLSYMIEKELFFFKSDTLETETLSSIDFAERLINAIKTPVYGSFPSDYVKLQSNSKVTGRSEFFKKIYKNLLKSIKT